MGKPLIYWTINSFARAGIKDIIVVHGPGFPFEKELGNVVPEIKKLNFAQK